MAMGKDAGLISAMKRSRPAEGAYTEDFDPSPLQYVTANEGEVRTAIKVLYLKQGAPPESEWGGQDGTINCICKQLNQGIHMRSLAPPYEVSYEKNTHMSNMRPHMRTYDRY